MKILAGTFSETTPKSIEPESAAVTNAQIEAFNNRNGTDVKPGLTAVKRPYFVIRGQLMGVLCNID
ncbi:MAG: hypothetical protein DRR06_06390 [Gammaproteobacteria bacterium]|nr:MAG: hypothetical protein DRR06_06390 [Gammaproteobacteria bacterium]RLA48255.1 MAG: hypothetical protein DRR42_16985 [Gammaproteobacteria bacterium]